MRLAWAEIWLINNPLREFVQKVFEGRQLLRMGGTAHRAKALEIGCGSGLRGSSVTSIRRAFYLVCGR
jgi:hypothetical protein